MPSTIVGTRDVSINTLTHSSLRRPCTGHFSISAQNPECQQEKHNTQLPQNLCIIYTSLVDSKKGGKRFYFGFSSILKSSHN